MQARIWRPYCGVGPTPLDLAMRWNLDPMLLIALAVLAALLWWRTRAQPRRRAAGAAALMVLVVTFVSPLCALSSALFSARTVHHVLLVAAAAPLLSAALPPPRAKLPLAATVAVQTAVFWAWHAPGAYGAALSNEAIYGLMQLSLLGSATLFWRAARSAESWPAAIGQIATMIQMGLLGALLALAPKAIYAPHLATAQAWGLTPLEDQQLAGLIMWIPAGTIYLAAAVAAARRGLMPVKAAFEASSAR
jgi:putative membrane protein